VILDHNSVILLACRLRHSRIPPVSSRTYFAVKLTNILVYTTAVTTIASWLPILTTFRSPRLAHGRGDVHRHVRRVDGNDPGDHARLRHSAASGRPQAIERVMSYVQLVMSFAVYGMQIVLSRGLSRAALSTLTMPDSRWLLVYPGTWFGSYLELASGRVSAQAVILSFASIALVAAMASRLGGRLSLAYSERLGAMMATARVSQHGRQMGGGPWFRSGEARAVALLVRSQFRNDSRFRMGVLGVLPVTLFYLWIGIRDKALGRSLRDERQHVGMAHFARCAPLAGMLRTLLTRSDSFRASWVFFTCPADHAQIARAMKNVLIAFLPRSLPDSRLRAVRVSGRASLSRLRAPRLSRAHRASHRTDRHLHRSFAALFQADGAKHGVGDPLRVHDGHDRSERVAPVLRAAALQQSSVVCRRRREHPRDAAC
jgi:hypothetical protein